MNKGPLTVEKILKILDFSLKGKKLHRTSKTKNKKTTSRTEKTNHQMPVLVDLNGEENAGSSPPAALGRVGETPRLRASKVEKSVNAPRPSREEEGWGGKPERGAFEV